MSDLIQEVERSLIKRYRKDLWSNFVKAIKEYKMIEPNDKIAVAISGGKDSLILAKLMQEIKRHGDMPFELEFISMNPGFTEENLHILTENCQKLGIPVKIKESNVFQVAKKMSKEGQTPCYMCARMRRGFLYGYAKELGCNKLALGHHFNDVIETTLINILYAGSFKTMVPKVHAENFPDMELIRPLFFVKEDAIKKFMNYHNIHTMNCGCEVAKGDIPSKRKEVKNLIKDLKLKSDIIDQNIFKSAANVNLGAILGYKTDDEFVDFNEIYEKGI